MAQYHPQLDHLFQALSDPTRRAVLARLARGPASVSELAQPFDLSLPSFMKHLRVLEESGWIRTQKEGRVRTCSIDPRQFSAVQEWLNEQRAIWEARTDRLERFVTNPENQDRQNRDQPNQEKEQPA